MYFDFYTDGEKANNLMIPAGGYRMPHLNLPPEKVPFGAAKTGNTTCASIPLMLSTLYPGINPSFEKVLICGFGTGLSCASGVIDLSNTRIFEPIEE